MSGVLKFNLSKRQKIVTAATLVTIGLLSTQLVSFDLRFRSIAVLGGLSFIVSLWALWEGLGEKDIKRNKWVLNKTKALVVLILPTFFTLAVASFYFLLPVRWLTRLPVAVFFGLMFYLVLLAQNVFSVAAIRTIPLYRAASTTAFLFTLLSSFFIFNVIYSFNTWFWWNGLLVFLVSFPLVLQVLWSLEMEERISSTVVVQSFILSLILGELALSLSFWPMATTIWPLTLSSAMYVLLGLTTHILRGRADRRVVQEYLLIGVMVMLIAFTTTSWTG